MKKLILVTIFMLISLLTLAEKKTIIVVDKKTQEELIGAKVIVNDSTYYTDFDGVVIVDVTNDSNIKVVHPSYETKISKLSENQVIELLTK